MHTLSSQAVVNFFWEDVICCHNYFGKLIIDRGSKNKNVIAELAENMG